jgi:FlaA1/EpsC-like NDP-sugar epimerase
MAGSGLLDSDEIIIADIRDRRRVEQVFAQTRPELVFHAAAHKHLPLLERHPCEGVKTNIMGTDHLTDLAVRYGVSKFVLISTDKAADPTSVLGATKRLAEVIVQAAAGGPTSMASVRFGNVLGSRGSLLTVLADQVAKALPITVTHPDVTRFFMTIEEAVGLVLEAAAMAEYAETFVLDMGDPVPIVELVHKYANAVHLSEVTIRFTGLRPGEKMNEKIFSDSEVRQSTVHPKVWATRTSEVLADLHARLEALYAAAGANDAEATIALMRQMLPEYQPSRYPQTALSVGAPYPDGF